MDKIINLIHSERKLYASLEREHYFYFSVYVIVLMLDLIVIIFTRMVTLNGYAWAGIFFLVSLCFIEIKQIIDNRNLKESIDYLYLNGEFRRKR